MLCDTSGVGERSGVLSTGSPFGHHPRLRMVCPPPGTVGAGWEVSLFSPSPLLHGFALRASPAVTHGVSPLGTVSADWEASLFSPSPLSAGDARAVASVNPWGYREDSDAGGVALKALRE